MDRKDEYLASLESHAQLPPGFRGSTASISFFPSERPVSEALQMDLALVTATGPRVCAVGRTTRNRVVGAPVLLARERMDSATSIIINNRIANVAAPGGIDAARAVTRAVASRIGRDECAVLPASTGIIGWRLPVQEMEAAVDRLAGGLQNGSALPLAQAIMTTDSYPKLASRSVAGGRIVGIAKGAGMIEPNLATMLVFLFTDIRVLRETLDEIVGRAIKLSFNRISVDGDQSTSDMVICISSGLTEPKGDRSLEEFETALTDLCRELSMHIVRNGEGTRHVIRCTVSGLPNDRLAQLVGKGIVNSPLVKTAVFGNDPNVGRILMAVGDALCGDSARDAGADTIGLDDLSIAVAGRTVYADGAFNLDADSESVISEAMRAAMIPEDSSGYPAHDETVDIHIELGSGSGQTEVFGSDLSYEYVRENADYRS